MPQRFEDLQTQIENIMREMRTIERRLRALEEHRDAEVRKDATASPPVIAEAADDALSDTEIVSGISSQGIISLTGRTLIVLGGAFLLRAITDSAVIAPVGGAIAGLLYAIWWLLQADRAAAAERRMSANFHGLATAIIAYPMIWETTARFRLIDTTIAAIVLVAVHYLGLAIAWRRNLQAVAWTFTLFSAITATSLLFSTQDLIPFTIALLVISLGIESLAFQDRWLGLRWPTAVAINLSMLLMVLMTTRQGGPPPGYAPLAPLAVIVISSLLPALYFGSIVARTILHDHVVKPFEFVQAPLAFILGVGGAVKVTVCMEANLMPAAISILLLGAASYVTSFTAINKRSGRGRNFYSYTTLAVILILLGSLLLFEGPILAISWSCLAIATSIVGRQFERITLKFHSAIYMVAASIACGLITFSSTGLLADPTQAWHSISPFCTSIVILAAACYAILATIPGERTAPWYRCLPRAILAAVVIWSTAGIASGILPGLLGFQASATETDPAVIVAVRPSVLAILAMLLAWSAQHWSLKELAWFVYPILIFGGVKLGWEGLQHGRPETLFVAFALYGSALIVAPRLTKLEF